MTEATEAIREALHNIKEEADRISRLLPEGDGTDRPEVPRPIASLVIPGLVHSPDQARERSAREDGYEIPWWVQMLDLPEGATIKRIEASVTVHVGPWGDLRDRPQHHLIQISRQRWGDGAWGHWVRPAQHGGGVLAGLMATRGRGAGNEVDREAIVALEPVTRVVVRQEGAIVESSLHPDLRLDETEHGVILPRSGPLFVQLGASLGLPHDPKVPSYGWEFHDLSVEVF